MSVFELNRQLTERLNRAEHVFWMFEGVTHVVHEVRELSRSRFPWFTLCGVSAEHAIYSSLSTEQDTQVTCLVCLDLMDQKKGR